jgi:protein SCO1/2
VTGKRVLSWMLVLLGLAVIPGVFVPTLMCKRDAPYIPDWGVLPPFTLVDERGQPFTEEALDGHPTIVSFLFTRCDTICPVTTAKMQMLQEKTFDLRDRIKLLSFTVDPTYDTPARLTAYAQKFQADPTRWRFVTGPKDKVKDYVENALVSPMPADDGARGAIPNIVHAGYFLLIDGERHLRGKYDSNDITELDKLERDARYLSRVGH